MTTMTAVSTTDFKQALGHFASGVTVVTVHAEDGTPRGLTISAFSSLSLDPPLILVCVAHTSDSHELLATEGARFGVNILAAGQEYVARAFATKGGAAKFDQIAWSENELGVPVIDQAHATLTCRVHQLSGGGDHTIVIGMVEGSTTSANEPLVHHRGRFLDTKPRSDNAARAWARFVGDRTVGEFLGGLGFDPSDRSTHNAEAAVGAYLTQRRDSLRHLPRHHGLPAPSPADATALVAHIVRDAA